MARAVDGWACVAEAVAPANILQFSYQTLQVFELSASP
jgi:hypothetical protein